MKNKMLKISHIKKSFGSKTVHTDLTFEVPEGAIFGLVGQNGAGKTTLMKMILGMLKPEKGEIFVNGKKVTYGQNKTNQYIGYLPDVPEFYNYMKPAEYLALCGEISGMEKEECKRRTNELLALVGLADERKRIGGFSRGMKQRLGIAQALFHRPLLLLLDEPTSALDPVGRKEILDLLLEVRKHTTVVFSTHILSDVERICDRIAVLRNGEVALKGTLEEIKNAHRKHSIEIEFTTEEETEQFLALNEVQKILSAHAAAGKAEWKKDVITVHTRECRQLQKQLYQICLENGCYPKRIAQGESTLESLFMEVVAE